MATGRPSVKPRTPLGQRVSEARQAAGLTQQELAAKVGVSQRVVAYWEREAVSLRADQVEALTMALQVSADSLLARRPVRHRDAGPNGRIRKVFEAVAALPRRQQDKIAEFVEAFVAQHREKNAA